VNNVIVGALQKCFSRRSVDEVLTTTLLCIMTDHLCAVVLFNCTCDMDEINLRKINKK